MCVCVFFFLWTGGNKISPRRQAPEAAVAMAKFRELSFPDAVPALGGSESMGAAVGTETEGSL